MLSNKFNFEKIDPGKFALYIGIILVLYGSVLLWVVPLHENRTGLEPQENISLGHSDHFLNVITKLNFIINSDYQVISIYYNILPSDKNGFLAIALPYEGSLEINNNKWYSEQLPSGTTVIFTNVTCTSSCAAEEDEFVFRIMGKLDSYTLPNHSIKLPFSNGISSEVVDEFHKISNGTSYRIGWDDTFTTIQMTLNKGFDEITTEPVARLSLIPNKNEGGNNNVLNWNLDEGNTVFVTKYSDNVSREFAEFRQVWVGIGIGSGITMIAAGVALVTSGEGIRRLKRFVQIQRHIQDANTAYSLKEFQIAKNNYDRAVKIEPENTEPILLAGNAFYESKKYEEAIEYYQKVLEIDEKHVASINNIGASAAGLGLHEEAIVYYDEALIIDPNHIDTLNNKGASLTELKKFPGAIQFFNKVLFLNPNDDVALANKGKAMSGSDHNKGIHYFNLALKINPKNVNALTYKGLSLLALNKYDEANACFDLALVEDASNLVVLHNKGSSLTSQGKQDEALSYFNKFLTINPTDSGALFNKGLCQFRLKNYSSAIESAEESHKNKPEYFEPIALLGDIYYALEKFEVAISHMEKASKIKPEFVDLLQAKAACYVALEKYTEAIDVFNKILQIESKNILALERKAETLLKINKSEEAIDEGYNKILEINENDYNALQNKASILRKLKKYDESIEVYEKALSLKPNDTVLLNDMGLALMGKSQYQQAIDVCYEKVLCIDLKNYFALINMGACLYHLGKHEESIKQYDKILDEKPCDSQALLNKSWALHELGKEDEAREHFAKSEKYKEKK